MFTQTWQMKEPTDQNGPSVLKGPALLANWREKGSHYDSPFKEIFTNTKEDGAIMAQPIGILPDQAVG